MNVLFIILILYTAYTFLWSRFGLGVTLIIQYILLGMVLLGFLKYFTAPPSGKNTFINWSIVLWFTLFLAFYLGESSATTQFKEATFVLLITIPFASQIYNPKLAKYVLLLMGFISVLMFFVSKSLLLEENENAYGGGYLSLVALPVLLYITRDKPIIIKVLCCSSILVLVLLSMKRGDIFACILAIIVYFAILRKRTSKISKLDVKIFIGFLFIIFVGYFIFYYLIQNSPVFAWKVQQTIEGDSTGRDVIYTKLLQHFWNSPFDIQLFGDGFDATVKIAGFRAHSDWLEILSCEGLLGVIVYAGTYISLFCQMCKRKDIGEKAVLASILTIWLVKSVFSMFIFSQITIILFVLTGYILNKRIDKQYEY